MNMLKAGFARVDVTAALGTSMDGYFMPRYVDGVKDNLQLDCLALSCGDDKVLLISMDTCEIRTAYSDRVRQHISQVTGVPVEAIFFHATHTHTGADLYGRNELTALDKQYEELVYTRAADAAVMSIEDLKPARMGYAVAQAPKIAFVRRFRMKDGSVQTNPGVNNPDILHPIGDVDERVNVLRFDREGADSLVLMNFGNHPDTVGGSKLSADWPGFARTAVERALPGTKAIFFNGAEGDVNHVNVHPVGGDLNDLFRDFDDVTRGYGHARHMGNVVAGGVLQVYDKVQYVDVDKLGFAQRIVKIPSNMPKPEEIALAHRYNDLHNAGKDDEIPYTGMMLTTVVAEAGRMVRLEHGPEFFDMALGAVSIGDVAMIAIPGEPFTGIGRGLKEAKGWAVVMPTCLTNGCEGYFPMQDSYDEGGYEARSSFFKAGVAELLIREGVALLESMR